MNTINNKILFELEEENENGIIFRLITKENKSKERNKIRSLRKVKKRKNLVSLNAKEVMNNSTMMYTFTEDDFKRLKIIEKKIINENRIVKKFSLTKELKNFFEI